MRFESDLFQNSFNRTMDEKSKKKTMEQELADKMKALDYQAKLEDAALSAEEKSHRLYAQNPEAYGKFKEVSNPFLSNLTPYQQGMLRIQGGQLGIQSQRANTESMTPLQKNLPFLRQQYPNLPDEQILQMLVPGAKKKTSFSFSD